jgi:hypothetical protein
VARRRRFANPLAAETSAIRAFTGIPVLRDVMFDRRLQPVDLARVEIKALE